MNKLVILIAGIVWSWCACAQQTDTISGYHQTEDVVIIARAGSIWKPSSVITPLQRRQWIGGDVGSFLDAHGIAHQLVAGAAGAASSLRYHGLSSDHAVLTWHGLPINSVTLGTCDMSLMPLFFFDQVRLYETPSLSEGMQCGMGLTIDLRNEALEEGSSARIISGYNSMRNRLIGAEAKVSQALRGGVLSTQVRAFQQEMQNRYSYVDRYQIDKPVMWQKHQQGSFAGSHLDLEYKRGNRLLAARSWWQSKSMELPTVMGTNVQGTASQADDNLRTMLEYRWWSAKLSADAQLAYTQEKLHYLDEPYAIDSRIGSQMVWARGSLQWRVTPSWMLKSTVSEALVHVANTNYTDGQIRKTWAQYALQSHYFKKRHELDVNGSFDRRFGSEGWSAQGNYGYKLDRKAWAMAPQFNLARRFRLPDMNELFWMPGGNPLLRPELGYHGRAGILLLLGRETRTVWRIEPAVYASRVSDWIQWVPAEGSVWTPVNYRKVQTQGVELHAVCEHRTDYDRTKWKLETRWNMNDVFWLDSTSAHTQRRMIYTPRFTGYQGVTVEHGVHAITLGYRCVSERFTDEMNTPHRALAAYGLCNVWYSASLKIHGAQVQLSCGVDNVFDVAYETLRLYAMPGRVLRAGLEFSFQSNKKNEPREIITLD